MIGSLAIVPMLAGMAILVYYARESRATGGNWYVGPDGGEYWIPGDDGRRRWLARRPVWRWGTARAEAGTVEEGGA